MTNLRVFLGGVLAVLLVPTANAAVLTFNSPNNADVAATRADWLNATGIISPQYLVDFETGFVDGQNISGISGLFPGGLVITDTPGGDAIIEADSIGGSNPVGEFAVEQDESPVLRLDFTASPVDYVGFQDIDHTSTSVLITFTDATTASTTLETTAFGGNSAEFLGIFRNDMPRIAFIDLDASGDRQWAVDNIEYGLVPVPAAVWLFGSGLLGLIGIACRRN